MVNMMQNFSIPFWLAYAKPRKFYNHAGIKWLIDRKRRKAILSYGFQVSAQAFGLAAAQDVWKSATFEQKIEFIREYNKAVCDEARREIEDTDGPSK